MGRLARKEREIARVRRDIAEAAARVFSKKGYAKTSMEVIAAEAGYAVGSLYNYFKGKDEIRAHVLQEIAAEFSATFDGPGVELDFAKRFEWFLRRQFEIVDKHRDFIIMYFAQRGSIDCMMAASEDDAARKLHEDVIAHVAELMQIGIDEGSVRALDPQDLAYFIHGVINATIYRWVGGDTQKSLTEQLPMLLDLIFSGIGTSEAK